MYSYVAIPLSSFETPLLAVSQRHVTVHTERHDVVNLMPHVVVDALGGDVAFHPTSPVAGIQAVPAGVLTGFPAAGLQPLYSNICFWVNYPSSLLVLLHIPIHLLLKVARDQIRPLYKRVLPTVEVDLIQLPRPRGGQQ